MQRSRSFTWAALIAVFLAFIAAGAGYAYFGFYNIAADEKHWAITERVLQAVRVRSIEARSRQVREIPNLDDSKLIAVGAGQYAEMCVECHLAPGRKESPLRDGLYPQPPDLSLQKLEPRAAFWTIKHGIKMTGMPAWGASHDDATLWGIVAFLQKLPQLDAKAYEKMTAEAPPDEMMPGMPGMKDMPSMGGAKGGGPAAHKDAKPHGHPK